VDTDDLAAGLILLAADCGYAVRIEGGGLVLGKARDDADMPPELLAELKRHRDVILGHLATACGGCGRRWWLSPEEIWRAVNGGPDRCDRAGCKYRTSGGRR